MISSNITQILCFHKGTGTWSEERALVQQNPKSEKSVPSDDVAYMLTSIRIRQTVCGEIVKGVILQRYDQTESSYSTMETKTSDSKWETTDEYVAIKVDRRRTMQQLHSAKLLQRNPENPWKEIAALQMLGSDHPNVISLLGAFADDLCLYEVMPYYSGGNLSAYMHAHQNGLPEAQARGIFLQIINGLHFMHSRGVCHHDISTENILFKEDENSLRCIIVDFGMCLRTPHNYPDDPIGTTDDITDVSMGTQRRLIVSRNHCGKLRFMAPEIYQKKDCFDGLAVDIWSVGVVLFILLTGRQPYEKPDEIKDAGYHDLVDMSYYWNASKVNPCFSWGHAVSNEATDLLKNMMCPDPRERATLGWIGSHDWLREKQIGVQQ